MGNTLMVLASHTVDVERLAERPVVLDVGCRGFDFARELLELRPDGWVVAMDPDPDVKQPLLGNTLFANVALVGKMNGGNAKLARFSTGEANFIVEDEVPPYAQAVDVSVCTISHIRFAKFWDLVKLDCEGSEFGILAEWPGPIADQISVEFHDWDKPDKMQPWYDANFPRLAEMGYRVVQHELSRQGEGIGHWDSLLVLDTPSRI